MFWREKIRRGTQCSAHSRGIFPRPLISWKCLVGCSFASTRHRIGLPRAYCRLRIARRAPLLATVRGKSLGDQWWSDAGPERKTGQELVFSALLKQSNRCIESAEGSMVITESNKHKYGTHSIITWMLTSPKYKSLILGSKYWRIC